MPFNVCAAVVENNKYSLRETYINPDKIIIMKEWQKPEDSVFPKGLDDRQLFSYLEIETGMHSKSITVVGRPEEILKKIHEKN